MSARRLLWLPAAVATAWLVTAALALTWEPGSPGAARDWREPLARAEGALARGDARGAERAWEEAHRAAVRAGASRGMLELGRAYLRIGEAAHDRATAVTRARRTLLMAMFHARERGDADVVAGAGEAFAALGDHEVASRAAEIALELSARKGRLGPRERVTAARSRESRPFDPPFDYTLD